MIKITGGIFKSRTLETISSYVRPTSSLKREAFFSILNSYMLKNQINLFEKKVFLDLFAGIGTMGLEAISRGIDKAIFYENNTDVIKVLKNNCEKFCKKKQYNIIKENIEISNLDLDFKNISIIYIDPPYLKYDIHKILYFLQNKINKHSIVGLETSINDNFIIPKKLKLINKKIYGVTNISILKLN